MDVFKVMTPFEKKDFLVSKIRTNMLEIYGDTYLLLNFCGLTQEQANELREHCNAIDRILNAYNAGNFELIDDDGIKILNATKSC